jgi:signal transduction histidine kinase/ActR/RegA family two-component response regulator
VDTEHFVQFYETDTFLIDSLSSFISTGLTAGDGAVVLATDPHLKSLDKRLSEIGIDVDSHRASGQFFCMDAEQALHELRKDGGISWEHFDGYVGGIISQVTQRGKRPVRIFGELVALLWAEGKYDAAIELEQQWNELKQKTPFSLYCAYPMGDIGKKEFDEPFRHVCLTHSKVLPAESYSSITDSNDKLRAIALLQQKARSLEVEVAERNLTEDSLRSVKGELEMQVADLRHLHELSLVLNRTHDLDEVLNKVLDAALSVQRAGFGLLSLSADTQDGIQVKCSRGFDDEFLKFIDFVPSGSGSCGTCFLRKEQVVVEDVETDPSMEKYRDPASKAGVRACHSTPLITRAGAIIGVLSIHFAQPHRPSERETRLMDLYAQIAVNAIENARLHHEMHLELTKSEAVLMREQMARSEAEDANRMKDEFLATVSHELRTPLNAILGWTHMLRGGRLDQATSERALETIERNAKSQAQLVEDILDVSRVISGKLRLNTSLVDLSSVINAAIDSVQLAADSKSIGLEVKLETSARQVLGDAGRLQQVIWNLLSNAIKFTPDNGRVMVRLKQVDSNVTIQVTDTGQGISAEFLPCVFDRFRQADSTSTRRSGGLGLGLSIVRHLVELHGGRVAVESDGEGRGTTFLITLPLPRKQTGELRPGVLEALTRKVETTRSAPRSSLPSLAGVNILLVDDDADTLHFMEVMLQENGAQVETASSAAEALELIRWYRPQVFVFDLAMPDEDGFTLLKKVRESEVDQLKPIPAIALTANVRIEDRVRALSSGFSMFVPKPVELDELVVAIANLVGVSHSVS